MIRAHCKGGAIRVMLQKTTDGRTNEEIWIPLHRDLAPSSGWWAHEPADKARRKRVRQPSLGVWFGEAIEEAGLPDACVMHGMRKTAARMLAKAGCSALQIASITGHKSLAEIERYTRLTRSGWRQPRSTSWDGTETELRVANAPTVRWQTSG